jgi:hypothetical protein
MRIAQEPPKWNKELFNSLNQFLKENSGQWVEVDRSECNGNTCRTMLRQAMHRRGLSVEVSEAVKLGKIFLRERL